MAERAKLEAQRNASRQDADKAEAMVENAAAAIELLQTVKAEAGARARAASAKANEAEAEIKKL